MGTRVPSRYDFFHFHAAPLPVWEIPDLPLRAEHPPEYQAILPKKRAFIGLVDPNIGDRAGGGSRIHQREGANRQGRGAFGNTVCISQSNHQIKDILVHMEGYAFLCRGHSFPKHTLSLLPRTSVFSKMFSTKVPQGKYSLSRNSVSTSL